MEKIKTLEIDIPNKRYLLNGNRFAENCTELSIIFKDGEWYIKTVYEFVQKNN